MTDCPTDRLLVLRRTPPLSNTMTVLHSSRNGWVEPPTSLGKLRMITLTSRQTGLERGDWPDLRGPFNSGEFLVVSAMPFPSCTVPRTGVCVHHQNALIFGLAGERWL